MKEAIQQIAEYFKIFKITCYYVGGTVRDEMMGITSEDIDICLVGAKDSGIVNEIFEKLLRYDLVHSVVPEVGKKFPVWIADIQGHKVDFALARKEYLAGDKRTDFVVETENVTIEDDLERRDLTINAMAKNVLTGELIDPFGGEVDYFLGVAYPVSDAFTEDTLRVYRAARFCARFNLNPSMRLIEVCRDLKPTDISNERVGMELMKVFKQCDKPSVFFETLAKFGWLHHHFIELFNLIALPQDPVNHPEGDVFKHTMHAVDQAKDWFTRAVMLCHDLGKAVTTEFNHDKNKITAYGHDKAGIPLTDTLLKRIHFCDHTTIEQIKILVELHMVRRMESKKHVRKTLRKLMSAELNFDNLVEVVRCDVSARPPLPAYTPDIGQDIVKELTNSVKSSMVPIVSGKKLIEAGVKPGREMGALIHRALELQDEGVLTEDNWMELLNINHKN